MAILNETQEQIDEELSQIMGISIEEVKASAKFSYKIEIFTGVETPKDDYSFLYEDFKHLNLVGYLRRLMSTSVYGRGKGLVRLLKETKNSICLDFGCGVGSHAIALMENGNHVSMLDVDGPLLSFAKKRVERRNLSHLSKIYFNTDVLPSNHYDLVICANVLEHVYSPINELNRITKSLKQNGLLYLRVSTTVKKNLGHFPESIEQWKQSGLTFLSKYFVQIKPLLYRKKR